MPPKFCPECGTKATSGKFCSECGTRFNDQSSGAPPPDYAAMASSASTLANAAGNLQRAYGHSNPSPSGAGANVGSMANYATPANAANAAQAAKAASTLATAAGQYQQQFGGNATATNNNAGVPSYATAANAAQAAKAASTLASSANTYQNSSVNHNASGNAAPAPTSTQQYGGYPPQPNSSVGAAYGTQLPPPPPAPRVNAPPHSPPAPGSPASPASPYSPGPPRRPVVAVPVAATGVEAQQLYEQCVTTIHSAKGGNNEEGVAAFRHNCKAFGSGQMDAQAFHASLVNELGLQSTLQFVPNLSRLIPDDSKRKELVEYNASRDPSFASSPSLASSASSGSFRDPAAAPKKGMLSGRYADHSNCDLCNGQFDVTRRRHQCRICGLFVCSSCSPLRLLIPPGRQIDGAKGYDPSIPQRVCIQCAPELHPLQDDLVRQYAQSHNETAHDAKGRIHIPFSASLQKECCNAADIIGNFFRDDWGASADRTIPATFLQKAQGLAVMTIIKAGFMITGRIGTGLVVARLPDGTWSAPSAIGTVGLGGGFEIGGELVEVMIILGSEGAVKVFHKPQVNLGAGLDLAVGPYGRSAEAAAAASSSGLNANYSYSHSKGLYAGISLQGTVIAARGDLNRKFYGRELPPEDILTGKVEQPKAASPLYEAIEKAMHNVDFVKEEQARRVMLMGPCRVCNCPQFIAHTTQIWNKNCKTCKHIH